MGFYVRKAVRLGPFRFNLSGSGVGVSVGVPGFRIGMSPRGNYVHVGRGGVYYRATIPSSRRVSSSRQRPPRNSGPADVPVGDGIVMEEIESAAATEIVDSSSADLVAEMNGKRKKFRLWPAVAVVSVTLAICVGAQPRAGNWLLYAMLTLSALATIGTAFYDRLRKTTIVMFDMDEQMEERCKQMHDAFSALGGCSGTWHISASGRVRDRKYHAGASSVVRRRSISVGRQHPPFVKTNIVVPSVPVGEQTLYFFPDKVLVFEANGVGAVGYENLAISCETTRFIEEQGVPGDAKVVDSTWRYVNKNGGPDRRFKDNRQLPIALYEEISFTSRTGLNETIQASRVGTGEPISTAIHSLSLLLISAR